MRTISVTGRRAIVGLVALATAFVSIACGNSPTSPTGVAPRAVVPAPASPGTWTFTTSGSATTAVLAQCLAGSASASCFSGARVQNASVVSAPLTSAPIFNNGQPVQTSGSTVTLAWTPPVIGFAAGYVIEASSTPGGPPNLANFTTGNTATTLVVDGVPPGTYFVRIRALDGSGLSAPSNEVQVIVGGGPTGGSCPSAPRSLNVVTQTGGNITLGWSPPLTGVATSYFIQAGSSPGLSNLANFDTGSTALTLGVNNVPAGNYYVRVSGKSSACGATPSLGPSSNEILLTITSGWSGQIVCNLAITGPSNYHHNETQTWTVGGPATPFASNRAYYPVQWSSQGSGGSTLGSWNINSTATTDITLTVRSDGAPTFDRTTNTILIRGGLAGSPTSYDLYEMNFPVIVGGANATVVNGTWSRPSAGGDAPVQPFGSIGTLSCSWSLTNY